MEGVFPPIGKGWSVLVALAAVGNVLLLLVWSLLAMRLRFRYRFSVRWLLLFVVVAGAPLGWFAVERQNGKKQMRSSNT